MNAKRELLRAFTKELLLAGLFYAVLVLLFRAKLIDFMFSSADMWLRIFPGLLAGSLTVMGLYLNILSRPLGAYLHKKNAAMVFAYAFVTPTFVFLLTSVVVILAKWSQKSTAAYFAVFLLVYASMQFVFLLKNLLGVCRLSVLYEEKLSQAQAEFRTKA